MKIKREVKIGLFALAMLVCLYLGVNYLKGKDVFSGDRPYYALFESTNGLQTSAPVLLRGVKVGSVSGIAIDEDGLDNVVVTVNVKKSINIPTDSYLKLFSNGLMGGKAIELVMGNSPDHFQRHELIPSQMESDLLESASSISLEDIVADAKAMMNSIRETSDGINRILTENSESLRGTMTNIERLSRQLSDARLGAMLADIGEFTSMLSRNTEKFDGIIGDLDEVTSAIAETDLRATLDTLGAGIVHLNSTLAKLSDGTGTAARLLDDPALYDSLTVATSNLAALLEDLKANPKRYVHFSLFGKKNK